MDQIGGFESELQIALFTAIEGVDYSMANQPIARAKYLDEQHNFDFDMEYTRAQLAAFEAKAGHKWK